MDERSDAILIKSVQLGDVSAFELLVKKYQSSVYNFALKILKNELYCEDVVQETFLKIYKNIGRVDTSKKFTTFLFGVAKNTAIDYLRSNKNNLSIDMTEVSEMDKNYERIQRHELKENVLNALNKLEKKYSKAIRLYYFKDLSYEEISEKLNLPVNTVRTRLSRGKVFLGKMLSAYEEA